MERRNRTTANATDAEVAAGEKLTSAAGTALSLAVVIAVIVAIWTPSVRWPLLGTAAVIGVIDLFVLGNWHLWSVEADRRKARD